MAWTELVERRNQRSRTYQNDADPRKRAWSGIIGALHYESILDSGIFDAEIDCTPIRVNNPRLDGWIVTQNSWHYALGKPGDKTTDGWVGFGGRQGAHWFKFRLLRVGYLHWPTRIWDDIGGAPNYDRFNLTKETNPISLAPNDDEIKAGSMTKWSSIWTTPGGGDLSISWAVNGFRLKEEIVVNQAGREWIAANRPPTTPLNKTYFGFVFQLDWSDIPKITRAEIEMNPDGDFNDDGKIIELKDTFDQLLAFMPLGDVRVVPNPDDSESREVQPVRKRFWSEDGNHYLLVGVRMDILNSMVTGDLIFDPPIAEIAASADDRSCYDDGTWYAVNYEILYIKQGLAGSTDRRHTGLRFTGLGLSQGEEITTAYLELHFKSSTHDWARGVIYCEDTANPDDFATNGLVLIQDRTRTANSVTWIADNMGGIGWGVSPSLISPVQEVVTDYDVDTIVFLLIGIEATAIPYHLEVSSYDIGFDREARLYIEYAVAGIDVFRRRIEGY